jgi:hypothetical protein
MKLNTNLIILLVFVLFTGSCKKENQFTEPNISDIKQKLRTNSSMGELVASLIYKKDENHTYSNANLRDKSKVELYINLIKQAKSREDIEAIFYSAGINNSKLHIDNIYFQNQKLTEIYQSVPELKLLTVEEKKKIFTELFKELFFTKNINKQSQLMGNIESTNVPKVQNMGCYNSFNLDWDSCESTYNYEMMGIWIAVLAGSTLSGELALAPLVAGGFGASFIAFLIRESCRNTSVASFSVCMS